MKNTITFLFILLAFIATAQRKSKKVETQPEVQTKQVVLKPIIQSIASKYILVDSSTVKIYLECVIDNLNEGNLLMQIKELYRVSWLLQPDFGIRERLAYGKMDITEQNCYRKEDKIIFTFEIPKAKNYPSALLLTEIFENETTKKSTNDLTINLQGTRLSDKYGLFIKDLSTPTFKNYVNQKDEFQIRSILPNTKDLFLIKYQHEFEPAQSPMSTNPKGMPKNMKIEGIIQVKANEPIKIETEGLYFAVEDTISMINGFGFLVVDNRFPLLTKPEKLVKPIYYMSTSKEIAALNENFNFKQALDRYFLTMTGGNQALAKRIIKTYYHRVEDSNRLFTSYKEGWKTDKGMVYIVLGPPNKVQRSRDREIWLYSQNQNFSEIIFTFVRKPNQFTENNYELVRYPEYQAYWYPFVEAWRTGNVLE
jgi:GWxTD domain-containing protein